MNATAMITHQPTDYADASLDRSGAKSARLAWRDKIKIALGVLVPTLAKGIMWQRPFALRWATRLNTDGRALSIMSRIRRLYGPGIWHFFLMGRSYAICNSPADVRRVLDQTPDPFSTAPHAKRAALGHFEPEVSLLSEGAPREVRRAANDAVLESDTVRHTQAPILRAKVHEDVERLLKAGDRLDWPAWQACWDRLCRRFILGDQAADDAALTRLLTTLRQRGNWGPLRSKRDELIQVLHQRVEHYLASAPPSCLAAPFKTQIANQDIRPTDQIIHWLFAFDAAAITVFRALGVVHGNAEVRREWRARQGLGRDQSLAFMRACFLETLRLWPTTPLLARRTTRKVDFAGYPLPADTTVLIFVPFLHRDPTLPHANKFQPEIWLNQSAIETPIPVLLPFSGGTGICPGRNIVLLVAAEALLVLAANPDVTLTSGHTDLSGSMPATFDHTALAFGLK